jgi:exosome complex RNA-binding protein Csl4
MGSKYIKAGNVVYNAVKPLAQDLGAKSVKKVKELASKAKLKFAQFELKQANDKLAKTFKESDKVLDKLKTTVKRRNR